MDIRTLTADRIARRFDPRVLARGESYYENDAVENAVLRGDTLTAQVEGSEDEPYHVRIYLGTLDITSAVCTCPYEGSGWCKHIAATLLLCANAPERVHAALPLADLLAGLDRDALVAMLLRLSQLTPGMLEQVADEAELQYTSAQSGARPSAGAMPTPNPKALRRAVRTIIGPFGADISFDRAYGITDKVDDLLLNEVENRLDANAPVDALIALEALTDEYVNHWYEITAVDTLADIFPEFGDLWTRTITAALDTLTPADRAAWKHKLEAWESELADDYSIGGTFTDAIDLL